MDDQGIGEQVKPVATPVRGRSFDIPILMYHHIAERAQDMESSAFTITRERFRGNLDYLAQKGFETISFARLLQALHGDRKLPSRPILITFDDGYESFGKVAVPELSARAMTATVFLVTGAIGGVNDWDASLGKPLVRLMDSEAIRGAIGAGMEIGIHGRSHEDLRLVAEEKVRRDLAQARDEMAREFGVAPVAFCYPFGRYDDATQRAVAAAGFSAAVSIFSEQATVTENPFAMRRIYVHQGDTALRFRLKLSRPYLRWCAFRQRRMGERCH